MVPVALGCELLLELDGFELLGLEGLELLELEGLLLLDDDPLIEPASPLAEPVDEPDPIVTLVRMNWPFLSPRFECDEPLDELLLPIVSLLPLPVVPVALCAADCRQPVSVISLLLLLRSR